MVIFLAGLQNIPSSLKEASSIDGASNVQQLFHITIPMLKPTIFFNLIVSMILTLPALVVFIIFQKNFIKGIATTGMKE